MDVVGLIESISSIIAITYKVGKDAAHAKAEMGILVMELKALKACLDLIKDVAHPDGLQPEEEAIFNKNNFETPEFQDMLAMTQKTLDELKEGMTEKTSSAGKVFQRLKWHFKKADVDEYLTRLERAKSLFTFAATTDNISLCREQLQGIHRIEKTLEKQESRHAEKEFQELQGELREWLCPHGTEQMYRQNLERLVSGTGKWFLDGQFSDWCSGKGSAGLWLKAKSGFGKTTLMAGAIDRAKQSDGITVAYWFCSFTEQPSRDLTNILGSLIYQICCLTPAMLEEISKIFPSKSSGPRERLRLTQLRDLLIKVLKDSKNIHIFIDAVNESKGADSLIEILDEVLQMSDARILISSTTATGSDIEIKAFEIVDVQKNANAMDIDLYIDSYLNNHKTLRKLNEKVKQQIREELRKGSQAVFRWVDCQLQVLAKKKTPENMLKALHELPATLEETYQRALDQVDPEERPLLKKTLLWLCYAYRRMRFEEICEAVVLTEGKPFKPESARLVDSNELREICPTLINYARKDETLVIAHSSVQDFLTSMKPGSEFAFQSELYPRVNPDTIIAGYCLSYLMMPEFASGWIDNDKMGARYKEWPLLRYIAHTLWDHLSHVDPNGPLQQLLNSFLRSYRQPRAGNFGSWCQAHRPRLPGRMYEGTTPLYWASRENHLSLVRMILSVDGKKDLEVRGGNAGCTPIHVASWAGNTKVVKELLAAGADVHEVSEYGENGLYWAINNHNHEIVEILKKAGVESKRGHYPKRVIQTPQKIEQTPTDAKSHLQPRAPKFVVAAETKENLKPSSNA